MFLSSARSVETERDGQFDVGGRLFEVKFADRQRRVGYRGLAKADHDAPAESSPGAPGSPTWPPDPSTMQYGARRHRAAFVMFPAER